MKFRQTLTAAAAAAVLAPAAVLATPAAAFATATEAPDRAADTNASQQTGNQEDGGKPGQPGGATESGGSSGAGEPATGTDGNPKPGTGNGTGPAAGSGSGTETGTGTGTGKDTTTQPGKGTGTQPGQDPKTEPGTTTGGSKSEDDEPSGECDVEAGSLQMSIEGWQGDFVAGAGWSRSSIKISNTTGKAMEKIRLEPLAYSFEPVDYPYWEVQGEIQDPRTGRWVSFDDAINDSEFVGLSVAPHSSVSLPLRLRAIPTATPGRGWVIMEGMFFNKDGSCGASNHGEYYFTIRAAHDKPGKPGTPGKPSKPGKPDESAQPGAGSTGGNTPQVGLKTQGGAQETAGTGELAATGSSSALPTIALVGGVAMAVGAGAVLTVRRRKAGAGSGGGAAV
ncbi:LPXTG cell wall anchor domain-containing protein [Streptomyces chrestomyceticus]|uniref:LPXTG cell wall anchor domain-containing protein n=1 Tax=Streptomyces chrestomyceticus TaxID=68185 RepID=UPI0037BBD174